ncbi:hypothetical protein P344_03535 [Spiroplasma mirum ATCC 29335]|uniref:Uncharacterized protein n=3 Tax=Spiroplasma mirum TaxID=2144 RepID=W6AL52_9MOLU|nr:hypothetical protein P344_03535 [Spiroplasma mirum ATCC 29335]
MILMTSGEASLLAKLEQIEHNQKKIMIAITILASFQSVNLHDEIINKWFDVDKELAEKKRLKAQAKQNGYTLAQWKKKLESDK